MSSRRESDSIGTLEVPEAAYYGVQTMRAIENFPITGDRIHPAFVRSLGHVKAACAQANRDVGGLNQEIADAIISAAEEMAAGQWDDAIVVDPIQGGAGTSLNMNANEVIANRALELMGLPKGTYDTIHPNTHVNMAQSTNDVIPTAFRIALLKAGDGMLASLKGLVQTLSQKAEEFDPVLKMGRTHLQDAVPIRLGQEFGAYARVLARDIDRIEAARQAVHQVNIGATAVGTGLNADPAYIQRVVALLVERTGFPLQSADDLVDATQNIDPLVSMSSTLKTCAVNLVKIANDLRLMASGPRAGFADIHLPARQPGSSIMPGKVNPVMPELVNQVAFRIMGNDHTVALVGQAGQLDLNVMQPVLFYSLLQSVDMLQRTADVFDRLCVAGITANEERTRAIAEASPSLATALNPFLGYQTAAEIAKESMQSGQSVRDIVVQRGLLPAETLDEILHADALTRPRSVTGDPSKDA